MSDTKDEKTKEPKLPQWWVLLLVGLGIPAGSFALLQAWAWANPWTALLILATWGIAVLTFAYAAKVWKLIESDAVAVGAAWVRRQCLLRASGAARASLQHVANTTRPLRGEGLSIGSGKALRLDEVFVDLAITPNARRNVTTSPLGAATPRTR